MHGRVLNKSVRLLIFGGSGAFGGSHIAGVLIRMIHIPRRICNITKSVDHRQSSSWRLVVNDDETKYTRNCI